MRSMGAVAQSVRAQTGQHLALCLTVHFNFVCGAVKAYPAADTRYRPPVDKRSMLTFRMGSQAVSASGSREEFTTRCQTVARPDNSYQSCNLKLYE
jgi:hypothetical protein